MVNPTLWSIRYQQKNIVIWSHCCQSLGMLLQYQNIKESKNLNINLTLTHDVQCKKAL